MKKTKQNKQVERTRKAIKDAFISLLIKYDFEEITVKMILDTSNYSKGTFYAHFEDKYDLVKNIIDDEVNIYVSCITHHFHNISANEFEEKVNDGLSRFFEHVYQNQNLYYLIYNDKIPGFNFRIFSKMNFEKISCTFKASFKDQYKKINSELFNFLGAHDYMTYIDFWIMHDFRESPKYMAEQAYLLMRHQALNIRKN